MSKYLSANPVINSDYLDERYKSSYIYSVKGEFPMAVYEGGGDVPYVFPMKALMTHLSECLGFDNQGCHQGYEDLSFSYQVDERTGDVSYVFLNSSGERDEGKLHPKSIHALASLLKLSCELVSETAKKRQKVYGL